MIILQTLLRLSTFLKASVLCIVLLHIFLQAIPGIAQTPGMPQKPVPQTTQAAVQTTLRGTVREVKTGERIPYATVFVKGTKIGTRTNAEGLFTLVGAPDSTFTLTVQHLGYKPLTFNVEPQKLKGDIAIILQPGNIRTSRITVTAEQTAFVQAEKTVSLTTISPRQLQSLPNIGQPDVFRSLQLLPGISGTNDGTSGLYVRGGLGIFTAFASDSAVFNVVKR
jgi:hypothetical protein